MSDLLVLWPRAPGWRWLRAGGDGRVLASGAGETPPAANKSKVVLLWPAEQVTLVRLDLPAMPRARLRQALPFALEEWVVGAVEDLHIAHGPRDAEGRLPVAALDRARLLARLGQLQERGIEVERLLPDAWCLPRHDDGISLARCDHGWIYHGAEDEAGFVENENLTTLLAALPAGRRRVHLYAATDLGGDFSAFGDQLVHHPVDTPLAAMLPRAADPPWQLLDRRPAFNAARSRPAVRRLAWFVGFLLLLTFGHATGEWWRLRQMAQAERAAVEQAFRAAFPNVGRIVDVRVQAERELDRRGRGQDRFLRLLGRIAPALAADQAIALEGIEYGPGGLVLRLRAPVIANLDELSRRLRETGTAVEVQNATLAGDRVEGRLRVGG